MSAQVQVLGRPRPQSVCIVLSLVAALLLSMLGLAGPASAAPVSPEIDASATVANGAGDVVLAWSKVAGATSYKVDISANNFAAQLQSITTAGLRATPAVALPAGTIFWRVSSVDSSGQSDPTIATFERTDTPGPALVSPGASSVETLNYPTEAPVLDWTAVPASKDYRVEWSTDPLFSAGGTTSSTTAATSHSIPTLLSRGPTWYWRVRGNLTNSSLTTAWSTNGQFVVQWPSSAPALLEPADDPFGATKVSDIKLRWDAVAGAAKYKVYVATDPGFTAPVLGTPVTVMSNRFSPPRSWDNAAYYWKVTALDPGNSEGPASVVRQFTRAWGPTESATMSVGGRAAAPETVAPPSGTTTSLDDFRLEWTSVPRASVYEVWLTGETTNFFTDSAKILKCYTPHTSIAAPSAWAPLAASDRIKFLSGSGSARSACFGNLGKTATVWAPDSTLRWRVRALDLASADTASHQSPGNVDALTRFIRSSWSDRDTAADPASVTVTADHSSAIAGATPTLLEPPHCADPADPDTCPPLPDTPELVWTPVADAAAGYWLQIALDSEFTNKVAEFHTYSTHYRMDGSLVDNSANQAYYWRVMGCSSFSTFSSMSCLQDTLANVRAFHKRGPTPTNLAALPTGDQVTFAWDWAENLSLDSTQSRGGTRGFRVQVATDELFSSIVWTTTVDQPFATTSLDLLGDGTYYWQVQAIDGTALGLPWVEGGTVTKSAQKPTQYAGTSSATAPSLTWTPVAGTASYELEVYNGDNLSVGGTNVLAQTGLLNAAFTPTTTLAPGSYSWRVRRLDAAANILPWTVEAGGLTTEHKFDVAAESVTQLSPSDAAAIAPAARLLTWAPTDGAVRYRVQTSTTSNFTSTVENVDTVQTKYALSGTAYTAGPTYYWRVRPLNATPAVLSSTDQVRTFSIQTMPGLPTTAKMTADGTSINISWAAPLNDGNSPLTGYLLRYRPTTAPLAAWTESLHTEQINTVTLSDLSASTTYEAQIAAINTIGTGGFTTYVQAKTDTKPSVPTSLAVTTGIASLKVTWSAPSDGGSPITGYLVRYATTADGPFAEVKVTGTTTTLTGLAHATSYLVDVAAENIVGTGPIAKQTGITASAPAAPTLRSATAGNGQVTISWTAPANPIGAPITGYLASATPGGGTCSTTTLSCIVTGLTNGTTYMFTVRAKNAVGVGEPSATSIAVIPAAPTTPLPPTLPPPPAPRPSAPSTPAGAVAKRGNALAAVSWTAPASNGGSAITRYTVTSSPGGKTCTTTGGLSCSVTGLANGTAYTFTVRAANVAGTGPSSAASARVVPATRSSRVRTLKAKFPKKKITTLTWSAPSSTGGTAVVRYEYRVAPKSGKPWSKWVSVKAVRKATIRNKKKGVVYLVEVRAVNAVGASSALRLKFKPTK